jgi:hypothetical protein
MKKRCTSFLFLTTLCLQSYAITILGWDFGTSCDLTSTTVAAGATISLASIGTGLSDGPCYSTGNCSGSSIGGRAMNTGSEVDAIADNDYFEFGVNAAANGTLTITGVSFVQIASSTGPTNLAIHVDGMNKGNATTSTTTPCGLVSVTFSDITVNPNGTSIVRIYAWGASTAGGTFRIDNVQIEGSVALPIDLVSFNVSNLNGNSSISWQTATEINNDFFTVQHSLDGRSFHDIETIDGAGNSYESKSYSFVHKNPHNGMNYYRLKQTDFDGEESFSPVESIQFGENEFWSIYPNPVIDQLTINLPETSDQNMAISIYDLQGKLHKQFYFTEELNQLELPLADLEQGQYFLKTIANNQVSTHLFFKK